MSKQQKHFRIPLRRPKPGEWIHDPILENPLDAEMEGLITMVGERRYLRELIARFKIGMNFSIEEITDHECRKVIRGLMRHAEDYEGPEMNQ